MKFALALAAGLSASVVSLASPQLANACSQQFGSNYAVVQWFDTTNSQQGGQFNTTVSPIGVTNASNGSHINQTLWVGTDRSINLSDYWAELGYIKGLAPYCDSTLRFYWGDQTPTSNGFHSHNIGSFPAPVVGEGYTFQIVNVGSSTWNINIDGSLAAQSTSPGGSNSMEGGLETSNVSNYLPQGDAMSLEHKINGAWQTYWGTGAGGAKYVSTYPQCTSATYTTEWLDLEDSLSGC